MDLVKIEEFAKIRPADSAIADLHVARCLAAAAAGDTDAYYDLGVIFPTGGHGGDPDLIEAHKWFNLAAVGGHEEAARGRADGAAEEAARDVRHRPDRSAQVVQPRRRRGPRGSRLVPRRRVGRDDCARDRRSPAPRPRVAARRSAARRVTGRPAFVRESAFAERRALAEKQLLL